MFNYEIGLLIVIEDGLDIDRIRKLIWFFLEVSQKTEKLIKSRK